jgi:hypothetical protein
VSENLLTATEDYLYTHGWRGHNIRLTLNVKDETDPDSSLRTLRGPEASLVHATQRLHPTGILYSPQSSTLLSSPVLPMYVVLSPPVNLL